MRRSLKIGTCSWKYESWRGLVYSNTENINYLAEYAERFSTVEVDQWFWSLFGEDKVKLPDYRDVSAYAHSVPDDFRFTVKAPNSITLTHFYQKSKSDPLIENPHFFSTDLTKSFLEALEPMHGKLGPVMFQFEYLNKKKMPGLDRFLELLDEFIAKLDDSFQFGVEIRNPNYLGEKFFTFLKERNIIPVFLQGYYMPSIFEIIPKYQQHLPGLSVIRLHGPDRKGIEKKTGKEWNTIVEPKDEELARLIEVLHAFDERENDMYVNVNNHYEGSAPKTIEKIHHLLEKN